MIIQNKNLESNKTEIQNREKLMTIRYSCSGASASEPILLLLLLLLHLLLLGNLELRMLLLHELILLLLPHQSSRTLLWNKSLTYRSICDICSGDSCVALAKYVAILVLLCREIGFPGTET